MLAGVGDVFVDFSCARGEMYNHSHAELVDLY